MADKKYKPGDGLKTVLLAGIGAMATTAEKSQEILDKLVEKGEITVEQGKALNQELKHKAEKAKADAKAKAEESSEENEDSSDNDQNIVDSVAKEVKQGAADAIDTAEALAAKIHALNAEELEKLKALLKDD